MNRHCFPRSFYQLLQLLCESKEFSQFQFISLSFSNIKHIKPSSLRRLSLCQFFKNELLHSCFVQQFNVQHFVLLIILYPVDHHFIIIYPTGKTDYSITLPYRIGSTEFSIILRNGFNRLLQNRLLHSFLVK